MAAVLQIPAGRVAEIKAIIPNSPGGDGFENASQVVAAEIVDPEDPEFPNVAEQVHAVMLSDFVGIGAEPRYEVVQ